MYNWTDRNENLLKSMAIMALSYELADLHDIKRGRPSLFYGGFFYKNGRYPTEQEIQFEIDRITKELEEVKK